MTKAELLAKLAAAEATIESLTKENAELKQKLEATEHRPKPKPRITSIRFS